MYVVQWDRPNPPTEWPKCRSRTTSLSPRVLVRPFVLLLPDEITQVRRLLNLDALAFLVHNFSAENFERIPQGHGARGRTAGATTRVMEEHPPARLRGASAAADPGHVVDDSDGQGG